MVIAANPRVADRLREGGRPVELIPFSAATPRPSPGPVGRTLADIALPRPIAGFMGHIGGRIDLRLLAAVAGTGCSLLLIGPRHPRFDASALDGLLARATSSGSARRSSARCPATSARSTWAWSPTTTAPSTRAASR